MKIMFWKNRTKASRGPYKHSWDGRYCCFYCGVYWWSGRPESDYGPCPGFREEEEDED